MGRLDPKTGEIKIIKSLTPSSRPYGLHITSKGVPVVVLFGNGVTANSLVNQIGIVELR